jgi:hypothetical protein
MGKRLEVSEKGVSCSQPTLTMSSDASHRRQEDRGDHQLGHPLRTTASVISIVSAEQYAAPEKKLNIFQGGYGTVSHKSRLKG